MARRRAGSTIRLQGPGLNALIDRLSRPPLSPLEQAKANVADHMDAILKNFVPGAKIAVLVRRPGEPTRDFMLTDDDPDELISMIQRRKAESL